MIVAVLRGGLGNQLFIYAAAYSLSKHLDLPLYVDDKSGYFKDKYKRKPEISALVKNLKLLGLWKVLWLKLFVKKPELSFLLKFLSAFQQIEKVDESNFFNQSRDPQKIYYLFDYFQSEKYFLDYSEAICQEIRQFKLPEKYHQIIGTLKSNALAIHGRLKRAYDANGQLVALASESKQLDGEYFLKAIAFFGKDNAANNFVIFSDAPSAFESLLEGLNANLISVDKISQGNTVEELILMSKSGKYIISNSTFSWWGAYLSEKTDKVVIAPPKKFWESDVPESWHVFAP